VFQGAAEQAKRASPLPPQRPPEPPLVETDSDRAARRRETPAGGPRAAERGPTALAQLARGIVRRA
jgi:hypothetical protein